MSGGIIGWSSGLALKGNKNPRRTQPGLAAIARNVG